MLRRPVDRPSSSTRLQPEAGLPSTSSSRRRARRVGRRGPASSMAVVIIVTACCVVATLAIMIWSQLSLRRPAAWSHWSHHVAGSAVDWRVRAASVLRNRHEQSPIVNVRSVAPKGAVPGQLAYHRAVNSAFFQRRWKPEVTCATVDRVGAFGKDRGICNLKELQAQEEACLVYSIGETDFSFEEALHRLAPRCEIHVFDRRIAAKPAGVSAGISFHPWGLTHERDTGRPDAFKTLLEMTTTLGHAGRQMDLLVVDCEGCEVAALHSWLHTADGNPRAGVAAPKRLAVELHLAVHDNLGWVTPAVMDTFLRTLTLEPGLGHGFAIYDKAVNLRAAENGEHCCAELSFVSLEWLRLVSSSSPTQALAAASSRSPGKTGGSLRQGGSGGSRASGKTSTQALASSSLSLSPGKAAAGAAAAAAAAAWAPPPGGGSGSQLSFTHINALSRDLGQSLGFASSELERVYNPSVVPLPDGTLLMLARLASGHICIGGGSPAFFHGKYNERDGATTKRLVAARLQFDKSSNALSLVPGSAFEVKLPHRTAGGGDIRCDKLDLAVTPTRPPHLQDVRAFWWRGRLRAIVVLMSCEEEYGYTRSTQYLLELDPATGKSMGAAKKLSLRSSAELGVPGNSGVGNRLEKNWAPLVHNGELYVEYKIEPRVVLHVEEVYATPAAPLVLRVVLPITSNPRLFVAQHRLLAYLRSNAPSVFLGNHLRWPLQRGRGRGRGRGVGKGTGTGTRTGPGDGGDDGSLGVGVGPLRLGIAHVTAPHGDYRHLFCLSLAAPPFATIGCSDPFDLPFLDETQAFATPPYVQYVTTMLLLDADADADAGAAGRQAQGDVLTQVVIGQGQEEEQQQEEQEGQGSRDAAARRVERGVLLLGYSEQDCHTGFVRVTLADALAAVAGSNLATGWPRGSRHKKNKNPEYVELSGMFYKEAPGAAAAAAGSGPGSDSSSLRASASAPVGVLMRGGVPLADNVHVGLRKHAAVVVNEPTFLRSQCRTACTVAGRACVGFAIKVGEEECGEERVRRSRIGRCCELFAAAAEAPQAGGQQTPAILFES